MVTTIIDYGMHGEGVAKVDGKVVLIPNALIDERVEIELDKDYKNYATAHIVKILDPSKIRVTPPCPYFNICGGCKLQHMAYDEQLKFKSLLIKKTIKKILNLDVDVNETVASDNQYAYRNKGSFAVSDIHFGYFKEGTNQIIDIQSCPIQSVEINEVYAYLVSIFEHSPLREFVKNIVIRSIENQTLVGIVARKRLDLGEIYLSLSKKFKNIGLYLIINTRNDSVVLSGKVEHVGGTREIKISAFGVSYSIDLIGFHQTNMDIQTRIYERVLSYITPNSGVLNGYSGAGLLSAIISKRAKHVYGIELNQNSHNSAEKLKFDNKIKNLTNILGDFTKIYTKLPAEFDIIVLDPAKKGCGKPTMQSILGSQIKNIIYISCNPIALCKDLREIIDEYEIIEITPFDMFPNTEDVETVVKLKRREK